MTDHTDFATLWSRELLKDLLKKRNVAQRSFDALKNRDSEYAAAHKLMLRLYDVGIAAIQAEMAKDGAA